MIHLLLIVALLAASAFATEPLRPALPPQTTVGVGAIAELRDDVYSGDIGWNVEIATCDCFSLYTDLSYRLVSYEWDTMWHGQRHEAVNLQVNGMNESFVGVKFFPMRWLGVVANWRFQPGEGSRVERFNRLGVEPTILYWFSRGLLLGYSMQYYTFVENENFQPGDEIGLKASFVWNLLWNYAKRTGWRIGYAFLYRWRVEESKNFNMLKAYQKMDDAYRGFRMRGDVSYYFGWFPFPLGMGMAYEMNRGEMFGFETGHRVELYFKALMP